jgi:hypothetical protein
MNSNQLPVSGGLAIFVAVVISFFVIDPAALDGFRPGGEGYEIDQVHGIEDVQARLWQDPFAASAQHLGLQKKKINQIQLSGRAFVPSPGKETAPFEWRLHSSKVIDAQQTPEAKRHSFKKLIGEIKKEAGEEKNGVTALAVMISAGPYGKQAETRLRARYAILSALAAEKYYPKDAEHIGYVNNLNASPAVDDENRLMPGKFANQCRQKDKHQEACKKILDLNSGEEQLPLLMPYEWYERQAKGEKHILLLWLDEGAFAYKPLAKLNLLFGSLGSSVSAVKLIGPYGSGTLKAMFEEAAKGKLNIEALKKVDVYSATATADERDLTGKDLKVASEFKQKKVFRSFKRTIDTDGKLMRLIVGELAMRIHTASVVQDDTYNIFGNFLIQGSPEDINASMQRGQSADNAFSKEIKKALMSITKIEKSTGYHVAIVSEWDTVYGRALPRAYASALCNRIASSNEKSLEKIKKKIEDRKSSWMQTTKRINDLIHKGSIKSYRAINDFMKRREKVYSDLLDQVEQHIEKNKSSCAHDGVMEYAKPYMLYFTYMRGIDGALATKGQGVQRAETETSISGGQANRTVVERPEGHSQKDYLRRLADQIFDKNKKLKLDGQHGIRAIGVLGSDVYDKLLILRVLRERFPKAVFFTTDIDASLIHPDQFRWTRNMVVASAFGMRIADKQQSYIPEFRDSYQTSIFRSARIALGAQVKDHRPVIYEIGRSGAIRLHAQQTDKYNGLQGFLNDIQENEINLKTMSKYLIILMFIIFLTILFWRTRVMKKKNRKKRKGWFAISARWIGLIIQAYICFLVLDLIYFAWVPDANLLTGPLDNHLRNFGITVSAIILSIALYVYFYLSVWRIQQPWREISIRLLKRQTRQSQGAKKSVYAAMLIIRAFFAFFFRPLTYAKPVHFAVFLLVAFCTDLYDGRAEPINLTEGVSIWPTEFLRLVAVWLSFFLMWRGWSDMKKNSAKMGEELELSAFECYMPVLANDIRYLWARYKLEGACWQRLKRVFLPAVIWLTICWMMFGVQSPNIPSRGEAAYWTDLGVSALAIFSVIMLFVFVVDSTLHCRDFIQKLVRHDTWWSFMEKPLNSLSDFENKIIFDIKRERKEIQVIAMLSGDVSRMVYYPIYVILLLLMAQSDYFDSWDMPYTLVLVATVNVGISLYFSIMLRRSAIEARAVSLEKMDQIKLEVIAIQGDDLRERIMRILQFSKEQIENIHKGAFLPVTEQPWLRALTLMTGGGSSLLLLQYLAG